jgi:hypothetical protein
LNPSPAEVAVLIHYFVVHFTSLFILAGTEDFNKIEVEYEIEGVVKGEQGLAALALGKFEDEYEI